LSIVIVKEGENIMNLREIRKKFNITQEELAQMLGMEQTYISRLETGECEMKVSHLGKLIKALSLNAEMIDSLIDDQTKKAKPAKSYKK
jgi:predicted transcriptional regulator